MRMFPYTSLTYPGNADAGSPGAFFAGRHRCLNSCTQPDSNGGTQPIEHAVLAAIPITNPLLRHTHEALPEMNLWWLLSARRTETLTYGVKRPWSGTRRHEPSSDSQRGWQSFKDPG